MSSSTVSRAIKKRPSTARRCLFGRPKKEEVDSWLSSLSTSIKQKDEQKWGFSFEREQPLPSTSSPYGYTLVDASSVPMFYRVSHYESRPVSPDDEMDQSMESVMESSSDESFTSVSSDPPVTPKKICKKRQAKITSFYVHRRKSGKISKESTLSSALPMPSPLHNV